MKQFFLFILKILVITILLAYVLDSCYTYVYSKSKNRNKIENIVNSGSKKFDVIMLGSSRANNHFDPQLFVEKGIKAYNYGMSGATLQESLLVLKLMMDEKYEIKHLILEVDLNIREETFSSGTRARFMPYLTTNETVSGFYKDLIPDFNYLYYIPFYRYIEFDAEIGFREMLFAGTNKKSDNLSKLGFYALHGTSKDMYYDLSSSHPQRNLYYEAIKNICKEKGIDLIVLSTPMCSNVKGIDYFERVSEVYPEVHNYEDAVTDDKYFFSCGHMNEDGARIFTRKVLADFFDK